jgi:hypothetical protein
MLTPIFFGPMLKLKLCQTLSKTKFSSLSARSSLSDSLDPGCHKDILAPMPKTPSNSVPPASNSPKTPKIQLLPLEKYPTAQKSQTHIYSSFLLTYFHLILTISTHPSSLTYFHLHSYPSSAGLSWSVNYIDLTPNRTRN